MRVLLRLSVHNVLCRCPLLTVFFLLSFYFYRPQRSCGKVMLLHLSVILFGGWSLSRGVSVRETPQYSYVRAVRILLECILVIVFLLSSDQWAKNGSVTHFACYLHRQHSMVPITDMGYKHYE